MTSRITSVPAIRQAKRRDGSPALTMITAYDEPGARYVDAAGVDMILVGDSVANTVLGYDDTLEMTVEIMAHHTAAVARARPEALIVGDLPWMSYHTTPPEAVRSAAALVRAGAGCVKLEGGRNRTEVIEAIINAEIPVMGHLGLTPQSIKAMGGYKVQGRSVGAADALRDSALALEHAGCFAIVLEGVPDVLATAITAELAIPTIGIGAGAGTDGQVLVFHDLLGLSKGTPAKFVRRYADLGSQITDAVTSFVDDVRSGEFPGSAETYAASSELTDHLDS